ncbi:Homeobox-leucine zipper protein HOX2 [Platanthera zijinensis]|uniref:Homeobox-leucine zipper protein HOX2 n=1 Tax=Platanthera zijinensis TaxID=2320716 RepID=A0AAP0FWK3_9ASPA
MRRRRRRLGRHASMDSEKSEKFLVPNTKNKSEKRGGSSGGDEEDGGGARKKLRLSAEQSTLLEESLTSLQKEELARRLGLRPRQVEVWFQNRRARIKLKRTEVERGVLKGWCENLIEPREQEAEEGDGGVEVLCGHAFPAR